MSSDEATEKVVKLLKRAAAKGDVPHVVIARVVGVTQPALSRWVNGSTRPRGKNLNRLVEVLRAMAELLKEGKLPLDPAPPTRRARVAMIQELLEKRLSGEEEPTPTEEPTEEPAETSG